MTSFHWQDNLSSTTFTPRDYQIELLAAAFERNIIVCLGHNSSKEFIALKLILEKGHELRDVHGTKKTSLFLTSSPTGGESIYNLVYHLTDLKVLNGNVETDEEWPNTIYDYNVVILNISKCLLAVACKFLDFARINLVVVEDCHKVYSNNEFTDLFRWIDAAKPTPKILGLAGPIHSAGCATQELAFHLEILEKRIRCTVEAASDIVTVLRYCTKPTELIVQCQPYESSADTTFLRDLIQTKRTFLQEHRYDPYEIYSEEFEDELKEIPDPKAEPLLYLDQYMDILDEFGMWCADRAAYALLCQIEKSKVKTPYERHYLLLCMVSTTFLQVRSYCDDLFKRCEIGRECIQRHSSPKALRLLEILRQFKPERPTITPTTSPTKPLAGVPANVGQAESDKVIEKDIIKKPEDSGGCKREENVAQRTDSKTDQKTEASPPTDSSSITASVPTTGVSPKSTNETRPAFKRKGHYHRPPRQYNPNYQFDPNALCGIIFCNGMFTAKILFAFLAEMTKHDPDLEYLSAQYTGDKEADPITEVQKFENEHRKQEEVLKRFRIHSCNLLIGTSVLEEGIELPKCNLVVRWDLPTTYRSYVQCKGKARTTKAFHVLMVAAPTAGEAPQAEMEFLPQESHRTLCLATENADHECHDLQELKIAFKKAENYEKGLPAIDWNQHFENGEQCIDWKSQQIDAMRDRTENFVKLLAHYMQIEQTLLKNCGNQEPTIQDMIDADYYNRFIKPYTPANAPDSAAVNVSLANAVVLVNKYCAKLPSDTFTKLTPLWRCMKTERSGKTYYQCTVRLPINSPVKQDIYGLPMPTKVLARRFAAMICCKVLHQSGELDDCLQPIGKEGFRASEPEWNTFELEKEDADIVNSEVDPRPGTTRRRQYYYKRIASALSDCRPLVGSPCKLYMIKMVLECPIPEEQNTRGRQIYAPEDSLQGFGILTSKPIPKLGSFSIFTRSGEVRVSLELTNANIIFCEQKLDKINTFLKYLFANVLRLQKYLMFFDANASENSFFVVPTKKTGQSVNVDWEFLDVIASKCELMPQEVPESQRQTQSFDRERFHDAVVMPWYRNQDQPQYFYVAEICDYLSPSSSFPGESYATFKEYYHKKYNIVIQNDSQPLLDVDHTSARLNFLTPRYVNRKGVALPTSSEETKRAKRENLEQKQILVPELCAVHPFSASLWRIAVCLPCVLYRVNALLLADEVRIEVSQDINLGNGDTFNEAFDWPVLDFGWKLADVLKRARENKSKDSRKAIEVKSSENQVVEKPIEEAADENKENKTDNEDGEVKKDSDDKELHEKVDQDDEKDKISDLLDEVEKKLEGDFMMDIGTWSNAMAENIKMTDNSDDEEWDDRLPSNISMCPREKSNVRYGSPSSWGVSKNKATQKTAFTGSDSDLSLSDQSDDYFYYQSDSDSDDRNEGLTIEFKSDNTAEAIETEEEIRKRQRTLEIINGINANEKSYQSTKNIGSGFDCGVEETDSELSAMLERRQRESQTCIAEFENGIRESDTLFKYDAPVILSARQPTNSIIPSDCGSFERVCDLFAFIPLDQLKAFIERNNCINGSGQYQFTLEHVYELHGIYSAMNPAESFTLDGYGSLFDSFNDSHYIVADPDDEQCSRTLRLDANELYKDRTIVRKKITDATSICAAIDEDYAREVEKTQGFSFDRQPNLIDHPGTSPSVILQALTMSNANDGINLERLETIGDSFLKYAITTFLYLTYENVHEGKLSHLRSRQVSNLNLYRLGKRKMLGERMIATKFEPHDNWLPPCYYVPKDLEKALIEAKIPSCYWEDARLLDVKELTVEEICRLLKKRIERNWQDSDSDDEYEYETESGESANENDDTPDEDILIKALEDYPCFIPYNLVTQHSIPDKSIADCVEALIGANLIECGPRGALLFMAWLGIRVLPSKEMPFAGETPPIPGSSRPYERNGRQVQTVYGYWATPKSPLLLHTPSPYDALELLLDGYSEFEAHLGYFFNDRSYLLQSMTHASYSQNRLTDCYQRLEFLGDAVLDYLITRHLYEDPRQHSPGALTDLRSALVNNTIFASLAVRHGFHKYFRHLSPALNDVIERFVRIQVENNHTISEEFYLISEEECDEAEDVEVPKALGDIFESVAGAIFLDSNMSLDKVWEIYRNMMQPEIEQFSNSVPKSPIRELLELEPETAKFGKPEKLADGRRVRVSVDVFGKGTYRGIGRNYRIAKCTAAKCALRQLKKQGLINRKRAE